MKTATLMKNARAAVERRASALAIELIEAVAQGITIDQVSNRIATHVMTAEWPAIAVVFANIARVEAEHLQSDETWGI